MTHTQGTGRFYDIGHTALMVFRWTLEEGMPQGGLARLPFALTQLIETYVASRK